MLQVLLTACLASSASVVPMGAPSNQITVGDIRVTALSSSLVRVEPKGPNGFEDRTTFMVVDRDSFPGIPITQKSETPTMTTLSTASYNVLLMKTAPPMPPNGPTCASPAIGTDAGNPSRSPKFAEGAKVADSAACCAACGTDPSCIAWVFAGQQESTAVGDVPGANCWPLGAFGGMVKASNRVFACMGDGTKCIAQGASTADVVITSPSGDVIYNSSAEASGKVQCSGRSATDCTAPCAWDKDSKQCSNQQPKNNLLHWPSPMTMKAYALTDYPRFFAPEWGPTPIPADANVDPKLVATNGYDFTNNIDGDTYIWLLGDGLDSWNAARKEFVTLAGPCPVLPDFAFGTWFTWWHSYNEGEAKGEVERWKTDKLPIDVWALDMNWRNTSNHQDWYYNHPATPNLFPDFTEWFTYLKGEKLRTYFNDHPYPVASRNAGGLQTSKEEVAFRWNGLSEWMSRGLTYWWFDHNWGFSIPPPFVNTSVTSGNWDGLDNAAWGSHIYYTSVEVYDKTVRDKAGDDWYGGRPMSLTKFGIPDWRPGMPSVGHQESPAQHRYPVWWTGDGVPLQGSVESMVDAGVHDFKVYVHSDCGGDYRPKTGGDLLRWTAHCAFGTIHRFHGSDHRPWGYDNHTEDVIRSYLTTRYSMAPSLVAAGQAAAETGFPFVTRCDLFWPEHAAEGAFDNTQYIFINDTLIAPIYDSTANETTRSVWVPPGDWADAWTGEVVSGPKTIQVTKGYEQQPMWHKKDGGLMVVTNTPGLRIEGQDWSELTLESFPSTAPKQTRRSVFALKTAERTDIVQTTDGYGKLSVSITAATDGESRAWALRVHMEPGQKTVSATVDGEVLDMASIVHIAPRANDDGAEFPFARVNAPPPSNAGHIALVRLASSAAPRTIELTIA